MINISAPAKSAGPAPSLECGEFQDAVMPQIKRQFLKHQIHCRDDIAAIAARIWRELRA
jgi:hypothetical protein